MEKILCLPEMYLPYSQHRLGDKQLHEFQYKIKDVHNLKEDSLIVHAPTGAGKTFAFMLPLTEDFSARVDKPKILIIAPTNALVHEIYEDISAEESNLGLSWKVHVGIWTARDLGNWWSRMEDVAKSLDSNDVIVSNPDIISLIVSGFYTHQEDSRAKQWSRIFRKISVMIIDEYDSYMEEELAKLLSFIVLAKGTGNTGIKYVFTSATPNQKLKGLLKKLGISFSEYYENPVLAMPPTGGRMFRGKVTLIFTDESLMDSVEKKIKEYDKKRTLFLFDHVADAERAIDKIMNKLPNEPILEITGLNTRSNSRRKPTGDEKFIVATNAAERGLNMKLEVAHIEPGLYLENLKQRLGRIARGESGTTYIHVNTDIVKQISTEISSDEDLFLKLEPIKPGSRDFYMTKVERVLSAYLYLVYKSSIGSLKFQVDSITFKGDCFSDLKKFDSLIPVFKESAGEIIDKKDIKCIEEWWLGYLRAYGFFRGQSTNVKVALPRIDHKQSVMDIVWLKKWTEYEPPEATDPERIFTVKSYRDLPRRVALQFNFCGKFTIDESVFKDSSSYRSTWEKQLNDFFDRYELDIQIYGNEKLKNCVAEMKKLIPGILKPLYPTIIPPVEVGELKDELFL